MKNMKLWMTGGVLGLLIVLTVANLSKKQESAPKTGVIEELGTRPTVTLKNEELSPLPVTLEKPERLVWQIKDINLPGEINKLKVTEKTISGDDINAFLGLVGMRQDQKTKEDGEMTVFDDGDKKSAYVNKTNKVLGFVENIVGKNQLKGEGKGSLLEAERVVKEMASKIGGLNVQVVARENKKLIYPRWVTARPEEAEAVEIRAVYMIGGYPLFSFTGEPIRVTITPKGRILKLEVEAPDKMEPDGKVSILGIMEINELDSNKVWVWKKEGVLGFEVSDFESRVSLVNITEVETAYVDNKKGKVGIYFIGRGNGIVDTKPAKVTIIVPAEK